VVTRICNAGHPIERSSMTSTNPVARTATGTAAHGPRADLDPRRSAETKAAFNTTEYFGYIASRGNVKSGSREHYTDADRNTGV
jgi:hypothetical protein